MKTKTEILGHLKHSPATSRGNSVIELALILPILMLLVLGVIDYGRAIHFNNILINISREGANLASRTAQDQQYIIPVLEKTAQPLNMEQDGMIYITQLTLQHDGSVVVVKQYRATQGATTFPSKIWSGCRRWDSGVCISIPTPPHTSHLPSALFNPLPPAGGSETFYAVESFYNYSPFIGYVMKGPQALYSLTVL